MAIIVPGEMISEKPIRTKYTYVEDNKTYATTMGMYDEKKERFVPLEEIYVPSMGDYVVGAVDEAKVIGYEVNLFSPYKGLLLSRATRMTFAPGDIIFAEVSGVSEVKDVLLSRPKKLLAGRIISISPAKISRVIGRRSSMLNMIKSLTGCEIFVGKNGAIWVKGKNVQLAIDTILRIEKEAHISGLTNRIQSFLSEKVGKTKEQGK